MRVAFGAYKRWQSDGDSSTFVSWVDDHAPRMAGECTWGVVDMHAGAGGMGAYLRIDSGCYWSGTEEDAKDFAAGCVRRTLRTHEARPLPVKTP